MSERRFIEVSKGASFFKAAAVSLPLILTSCQSSPPAEAGLPYPQHLPAAEKSRIPQNWVEHFGDGDYSFTIQTPFDWEKQGTAYTKKVDGKLAASISVLPDKYLTEQNLDKQIQFYEDYFRSQKIIYTYDVRINPPQVIIIFKYSLTFDEEVRLAFVQSGKRVFQVMGVINQEQVKNYQDTVIQSITSLQPR